MMFKRMSVVVLVLLFLNFANFIAVPEAVYAETYATEEEKWESWRAITGIAAVLFLVWVVTSDNNHASNSLDDGETKAFSKKQDQDNDINVSLDFAKSDSTSDYYDKSFAAPKDGWRSPELKLGYNW